ncbi:MAG: NAD(P)H-binding protein [Mariniphaga sp.]|nr:NAD(P)H-binding protein [Mariniphaga sp.]
MKLTANVVGATGLIGNQLVRLLLKNEKFEKVRIFVRRDTGIQHPKLDQQIIDFRNKKTWKDQLTGDVLFSALGTTLKQAGSKEKEYEVDFMFNLNFAKTAKENGISNYVLVSSIGADSKSRIFYTQMKGELDDAIAHLEFKNLAILRPSSLTGDREEKRMMEVISIPVATFLTKFFMKKYRPIKDEIVAQAMINAVIHPNPEITIWEGDEVFKLAEN